MREQRFQVSFAWTHLSLFLYNLIHNLKKFLLLFSYLLSHTAFNIKSMETLLKEVPLTKADFLGCHWNLLIPF